MSNFIGGNRSDPSEVELQRQQTDRQKYGLQTEWGRGAKSVKGYGSDQILNISRLYCQSACSISDSIHLANEQQRDHESILYRTMDGVGRVNSMDEWVDEGSP